MPGIELTSRPGKTFTVTVKNPTANYATLATGIAMSEISPGRYRATYAGSGIVWVEASSGVTMAVGFADFNLLQDNGYAEVTDVIIKSSVTVLPVVAIERERQKANIIPLFVGELTTTTVAVRSASGATVVLDGKTLSLEIETQQRTPVASISISATGSNFVFTPTAPVTLTQRTLEWALWDAVAKSVICHGTIQVGYVPILGSVAGNFALALNSSQSQSQFSQPDFTVAGNFALALNSSQSQSQFSQPDVTIYIPPPGLVDTYPALAAYSTRRLSSTYAGPCLRVRENLTQGELDIGFVNGSLDTASLLAFVGPTYAGFVTKWYDQSGNGRHALQATNAAQPRICIGGAVDINGGLPALLFGGSHFLRYGSAISCSAASSYTVFEETSNSTNYSAWSTNPTKSELWRFGAGGPGYMSNFSTLRRESFPAVGISGRSLAETYHSGSSMYVAKNGTTIGTDTSKAFEAPTELQIGKSEYFPLTGPMGELILFNSDQTANASAIRSDINSYFFNAPYAAIDLSVSGSSSPFTLLGSGLRSNAGPGETITNMEWEITLLDQGNRTIGFYGAPDAAVFPWYDSASIVQRDINYPIPTITGTNKQWGIECTTSAPDANLVGRVNVRLTITNSIGETATYG